MSNLVTWPYVLRMGHTDTPENGACAMAAVSWLKHGIHSDAPPCASPVIGAFVISGNDGMLNDIRQKLLPYLHRIADSVSPEHEAIRLRIIVLGALRVFTPVALDKAGLHEHAEKLRALPDDVDFKIARIAANAALDAGSAVGATDDDGFSVVSIATAALTAAEYAASVAVHAEYAAEVAAEGAGCAASAAEDAGSWDEYFAVLDQALNAGPQGDPWSADVMQDATALYQSAGGLVA